MDYVYNSIQEVSTLTLLDQIYLISTVNYVHNRELQCSYCLEKYKKEHRDNIKGCTIEKNLRMKIMDIVEYRKCPSNWFNRGYLSLLEAYRQYESGNLPYSGGILEQPARIIELFNFIATIETERKKEQAEIRKKWQSLQSKSK